MSEYSFLGMVCAYGLTIALTNSAQAAAFVIDDFNVDTFSSVSDSSVDGSAVSAASVIDGINIVMNGAGWTRTLTADLTVADSIETEVCDVCKAGHVTVNGPSNGIGTYTYAGSPVDLSDYNSLGFDWGADLPGASVDVIFSDGSNTLTVASWSSLAATGGSAPGDLVAQAPMAIAWGSLNRSAITQIQFVVNGVPGLDSILDNFTAMNGSAAGIPTIPEWGLVLMMLGMMLAAGRRLRPGARQS